MKRLGMPQTVTVVALLVLLGLLCSRVLSHCEIPCGIYNDPARIERMAEHIQTIEKSMRQIRELAGGNAENANQLTRWIINKEDHADKLSDIVTQYFMKQRIAPVAVNSGDAYDRYVHKLTLLHSLMVTSMKCKQTTDLAYVSALRETLSDFEEAYLGKEGAAHAH